MHPIFFAYGPRIQTNKLVNPFDTVDLMHLFCELLGFDPPSYVEGKRDNILEILKEDSEFQKISRTTVMCKRLFCSFLKLIQDHAQNFVKIIFI